MPRILDPTPENIAHTVETLRAGGVVALPTETVYGLAADTLNPAALQQVFDLKGRPASNPLIAHVLDVAMARRLVSHWPREADLLAGAFWPGPLTLVLPKATDVPSTATANLPTIAIRCPSHEVIRAVLERLNGPLSAPSANRSGQVSPTEPAHVAAEFRENDDLIILDGGPCSLGIESTVLDLSPTPTILRPGSITLQQIETVLARPVASPVLAQQAASPGTSLRHYAPRKPTFLLGRSALRNRLRDSGTRVAVLALDHSLPLTFSFLVDMPHTPELYAHSLYRALRNADNDPNCDEILIELPPPSESAKDPGWIAILDRLRRAAAQ